MTFRDRGFVGPLDILSRDEATRALEQVRRELAQGTSRCKLHLILPAVDRIAHHPKLVAAVREALGAEEVWLWSSDVNTKEGGRCFFAPHQDATFAGLSPSSRCLTAWVALSDPVGAREGCLSFYPASHRRGPLPHARKKDENNMLVLGQYIDAAILETLEAPMSVPLRGGQATLHSFECVHASGANASPEARVGLALRYMTADVEQTKPNREMATWICGGSPAGTSGFDREPRLSPHPTEEEVERGRRAQREAIEREDSNYFATKDD